MVNLFYQVNLLPHLIPLMSTLMLPLPLVTHVPSFHTIFVLQLIFKQGLKLARFFFQMLLGLNLMFEYSNCQNQVVNCLQLLTITLSLHQFPFQFSRSLGVILLQLLIRLLLKHYLLLLAFQLYSIQISRRLTKILLRIQE